MFAPGSVGNVGPGFDVLGLAVSGIGDTVSVELDTDATEVRVRGRDARLIPTAPEHNAAAIAAFAYLERKRYRGGLRLDLEKGLPLSGGLGGSAASSVGGALAAALAFGARFDPEAILTAAAAGEAAVAGRHYDNLAPCLFGGVTLLVPPVAGDQVPHVARIPPARPWVLALVTPAFRLPTKRARAILPRHSARALWVPQMARTAALVHAIATGDEGLATLALDDLYAEPLRARLIPHFDRVKRAALGAGAIGCSVSGAGPTLFALCRSRASAARCAAAMRRAFAPLAATVHVGGIAATGARRISR
ncbi:MAG: homoserine kinase [Deltaproteobacteria bacterium]|nr:homoserine kinase [Deltaproteobacteria bacterium]